MKFRFTIPLLLCILLTVSVKNSQAQQILTSDPKGLIQVVIQSPVDLTRFAGTGLPVFVRLQGRTNDYILTGANPAHLQSLDEAALTYTLLDAELKEGEYFLASPLPNQPIPDWTSFGQPLLDDGIQTLLRATPDQALILSQQAIEIRALTLTPKPLYPSANPEFPTMIDPDPTIQTIIDQVTTPVIHNLTGELSGEWPVTIGGSAYTIATRHTYSGTPIQKATQYVGERLAALGLDVEYHQWGGATYPNVIGELPGQVNPDEIFIIGAHLDNMPSGSLAPGADDNASGSVATLLAADILSQYQWGCTLRFAFWTGEEQGLYGSEAYAARSYATGENIAGYLNLDMIAWNTGGSNPDIDLHANANLPATLTLAQLFADVIDAYEINLIPQIVSNGTGFSDHASFWTYGYTSILAIEDYAGIGDFNPYYHTTSDDMDNFQDWPYYTNFVRASIASFAHMADCLIPSGLGYLDGTVTASDGATPIPEAMVIAQNPDGQSFSSLTDENGYYTRTLMANTYTVTASAFGYLPGTLNGVIVVTDTLTTADIALQTAPTVVVSGTVVEAGTGLPLLAQVSVLATPLAPVWTSPTGFYSLTLPLGIYTIQAWAESHHSEQHTILVDRDQTLNFTLEPLACILLVDDDNNAPDVRTFFAAALDNLGYDYDVFDVAGGGANGPDLAGLQGYPHVIWFSGDKYGGSAGPNGTDETALSAYLNGGGNLFLSAQDYLYDFGLTSFGQTYLGVNTYSSDNGDAIAKYGVPGDPIGGGTGPYPLSYPAGFSEYGDIVNPQALASVAFRSSAVGGNNLDLDKDGGAWKTVFFGTSWVPVYYNNPGNGEELLDHILGWFGGCEPALPDVTINPVTLSALLKPDKTETQGLEIGNQGEGILTWALDENPPVDWLDENITNGIVMPQEAISVTITFDATDMNEGIYTTTLHLTSNDPDQPLLEIPVTLTVYTLCHSPGDLDFTWTPLELLINQPITFTASVTGTEPITLTWDFGNGTFSEGRVVTHTFTEAGIFAVTLTAENRCGVANITHTLHIFAEPPPTLAWEIFLPAILCDLTLSP